MPQVTQENFPLANYLRQDSANQLTNKFRPPNLKTDHARHAQPNSTLLPPSPIPILAEGGRQERFPILPSLACNGVPSVWGRRKSYIHFAAERQMQYVN